MNQCYAVGHEIFVGKCPTSLHVNQRLAGAISAGKRTGMPGITPDRCRVKVVLVHSTRVVTVVDQRVGPDSFQLDGTDVWPGPEFLGQRLRIAIRLRLQMEKGCERLRLIGWVARCRLLLQLQKL